MTEIENFINFDKLDKFDEDRNFNLNVNVEDFINSNHQRSSNHSSYDNNDLNGDNLNQLNILSDIYVDSQHQQPLSINVKDLQNSNYSGEIKSEAVDHDNDDDNDNENENVDYSSDSNSTIPSQSSSNNVNSKDSKLKNSNTNSSNKRKRTSKDVNITSAAAEANLSPQEYNKLSSKEKRQLRNKISARAFRLRRKDYIEQLECQLQDRDEVINNLKLDLKNSKDEIQLLKSQIQSSTTSTNSASTNNILNNLLVNNTPPTTSNNFMSVYTTLIPHTSIPSIYDLPPPYSSTPISSPPPYSSILKSSPTSHLSSINKSHLNSNSKHCNNYSNSNSIIDHLSSSFATLKT